MTGKEMMVGLRGCRGHYWSGEGSEGDWKEEEVACMIQA